MSLTKLSLGGNNDVIYKLFPPRESLVGDIPAGDGVSARLKKGWGAQMGVPLPKNLGAGNFKDGQREMSIVFY
jgi:hypothetical protein